MSSTNGRTFLDTNVLVYAVDEAAPAKRDVARTLLASPDATNLVVSSQVLAEFYVVVTRKLATPMDPVAARQAVGQLSQLAVVAVDAHLVLRAAELSHESQLSLWDALVIEAAARSDCARVLTEDLAHGTTLAGVHIENPFA